MSMLQYSIYTYCLVVGQTKATKVLLRLDELFCADGAPGVLEKGVQERHHATLSSPNPEA